MRNVTLTDAQDNPIGNAVLPSDFPMDPPALLYRGKVYVAAGGGGWTDAPGGYEAYTENPTIILKEDQVSPPTDAPK